MMLSKSAKSAYLPVQMEPHYTTRFYAEWWGVSNDTVLRWFQDRPGVLKLGKGKRVEVRIPLSIAMSVYAENSK